VTALSGLIFDKQLAAFGQLQNNFGSLDPAKSKCIGLDIRSIQLWVHSEKGAKRVKPVAASIAILGWAVKAAANQIDELRANGPYSPR